MCPTVLVKLPCGDIHICGKQMHCPYLEVNDDNMLVCRYTGIEHGPEDTSEFFDINGGRLKSTNDTDMLSGACLSARRKYDPIAASRVAFDAADQFTDTDFVAYTDHLHSAKLSKKSTLCSRAALCVGESNPISKQSNSRDRFAKQNVQSQRIRATLQKEAEWVINQLLNFRKPELSFECKLRRHIRSCRLAGHSIDLDTIHNISLECSSKKNIQYDNGAIKTVKFLTHCSSLILTLWIAICTTPYMSNAKKNNRSYRPFISGVLYATKRGVQLFSGTIVIPKCTALASALPTVRKTGESSVTKTLHSSSHRGMRLILKSIASVPKSDQHQHFADSIALAARFKIVIFSSSDL